MTLPLPPWGDETNRLVEARLHVIGLTAMQIQDAAGPRTAEMWLKGVLSGMLMHELRPELAPAFRAWFMDGEPTPENEESLAEIEAVTYLSAIGEMPPDGWRSPFAADNG